MMYVRIDWTHDYDSEPIAIYSEINHEGYEVRKIELYRDGQVGFAQGEIEYNGAGLSEKTFPPLDELNSQDEWDETRAELIHKEDFERVWVMNVLPILHKQ